MYVRLGGGVMPPQTRSTRRRRPAVSRSRGDERSQAGQQGQFAGIQRSRLLAAAIRAVDELGYSDTSVADITSRARVSRRTFYEQFPDREACLVAALEDALGVVLRELAGAGLEGLAWRERVRAGLSVILAFFDREPVLARVCVVQALRGGPLVLKRREAVLSQLAAVVDGGRGEGARGGECTPLTAEGLVGAAFGIVYARLLRGERRPLVGLLGELMGMIVLPYLGLAAARREQSRPAPAALAGAGTARTASADTAAGGSSGHGRAAADPLESVPMRLTYRTSRVLEGVAELAGRGSGPSNRQVGEYAGIPDPGQVSKVKVSLPKQLPSPLKTLQKACTEKVFAENPANCPKASNVGEANVSTPVLEGGLSGPAYFVSHGGAKYPELIMVLTGEDGVTVQVHGETFISKAGITTATFATVPDVPFSTFELTLPEREYPALSANGNLCQAQTAGKLLMPTEMVGQNGLVISQSTKISVTGCPKLKTAAHHKASKKKAKHPKRKARGKSKTR